MKNFDIGGVQFDVAAVSQVKSCSPEVMADETNPVSYTHLDVYKRQALRRQGQGR